MIIDSDEVFREATIRLCGTFELQEGLEDCRRFLSHAMPVDALYMIHYELDRHALRLVALAGVESLEASLPQTIVPLQAEMLRYLDEKRSGVAYRFDDAWEAPPMRLPMSLLGWEAPLSAMNMKLAVRGRVVGAVGMVARGDHRYEPEHAELLQLLNEPLAISLVNALRFRELQELRHRLAEHNRALRRERGAGETAPIVGEDGGLSEVMALVRESAPLDCPILILGETGVGKELVANAIHARSPRAEEPLVKVNCGSIPDTLIDSELFGHERGAFTGAMEARRGLFERADGGTIFLDEVGELSAATQVRLLRVLQENEFQRVGGIRDTRVDVRVVAATHRNLPAMVAAGDFREDLFYRINVFPIEIPPLRARKQDLPLLLDHVLRSKSAEIGLAREPELAPVAMEQLQSYEWPGNVRELQNVIERALILHRDTPLAFPHLQPPDGPASTHNGVSADMPLRPLDEVMAGYLSRVLAATDGRIEGQGGAAEILGLHPNTLRARLRKLGIPYGRRRK